VPYIGIYLKDLVFIQDGTPDRIGPNVINFAKRRRIAEVISSLDLFRHSPYQFHQVAAIQFLIDNVDGMCATHCVVCAVVVVVVLLLLLLLLLYCRCVCVCVSKVYPCCEGSRMCTARLVFRCGGMVTPLLPLFIFVLSVCFPCWCDLTLPILFFFSA
jgi:RasGEF domain